MQNISNKFLFTDFKRILSLLSQKLHWKIYALFALMFLVALFEVLSILSMSFIAMSVAAPQALLESRAIQAVLRHAPALASLFADLRWFTLAASLGVVLLTAFKNALTALLFWNQSHIGEEIAMQAGDDIMRHYLGCSYMRHISGDTNQTMMALGGRQCLGQLLVLILNVYTYALTSVALIAILVSATPGMIVLVLGITGFISFAIYKSMKRALDRCGAAIVHSASEESRATHNALRGIREVLIYRQQKIFREKFLRACRLGTRARAFQTMAPPIPAWILETIGMAAIPFTTWILIRFYNADMALIAGVVTMVMLAAWRILPLLNRSLGSLVIIRSISPMAMTCLNRLEEIRREPHPLWDVEPDPDFRFKGALELADVSFRYPGAQSPALSDIRQKITKGMQIGLVGQSGSGKSTLAGILAGLLEPESGDFLVDGVTLTPAGRSAYRAKIGYVPQSPYLLAGSIAENVAFSQWGKPWNAEKVWTACRMAALDVVDANPAGINYMLGENGAGLSGGQAQRVAIARALYADPEILILDESTSALDQHTESAIMHTINALKNKLTIIIIAHRLTTVEHCDRIIWLENGRIRKQGPTGEVLPAYRANMK